MARAAGYGSGPVPDLWFVLFDGQECMVKYGKQDGFHGSRRVAGRRLGALPGALRARLRRVLPSLCPT